MRTVFRNLKVSIAVSFCNSIFDLDSLTWPRHAPANSDRVFAAPLVQLLTHFLHLSWIEGP